MAERENANIVWFDGGDPVNFGDVPKAIDSLLQAGVIAYRRDPERANALFRQALAADPTQLPAYFCLYKIHAYQNRLDEALAAAHAGFAEAARQAGLSEDASEWPPQMAPDGPRRFALYTLKAMAFIHLRRDDHREARRLLDILSRLDPTSAIGWRVVEALAEGAAAATDRENKDE